MGTQMTNETKTAPAGELMDTQIIEVAGVFALDALGITNTLRIARAIIAADRALVKRSGTQGTDENVRMLEMANLIAASACPEEESRLEVAYAIARHLRLDWPAAQLDTFAERELRRGDVAMPVVAWRKEFETLAALASYTDFSSEAALSLGWESLVKQSDAQAALDKKDSEIEQKDSTIFSEKDLNQRLLAMHSDAWRALADRGLLNGGKPLAESILRLPHFEFLKSFNAGCDAISSIAAHLNIDM